jgi:gliding motility-associated-like protein
LWSTDRNLYLTMLFILKKTPFLIGCFIGVLPVLYSQQSLNSPGNPGRVIIGDLDISGNQITVEALIRRTGSGGPNILSKHTDPSNVNYLLRPTTFELTTTNGFLLMNNPYTLQNNRWYHIAGTYDGAHVRYYVNGCLVVQQPWTGNLVTNNLQACIGNISSSPYGEGFVGQIDELRVWDIARTETQIKQNMVDLPNPTTYPNLRAYYKFEGNYNNILGTGFNGTISGTPAPSLIATTGELPTEFSIISVDATDNVICSGSSTGSVTIVPSVETGTTYSLNGGAYQESNVFSGLTAGTYSIDVRSQEGCVLSSVTTVVDGTVLQASSDQTICLGETVQLNATGGGTQYRWDAHPSLSSTTIPNPSVTPTTTTTYTVRSKVRSGPNLVKNGNFEMGNSGFTSGYTNYISGDFHQGYYTVTSNSPTTFNGGFANCTDHTAIGTNLLLADGACGTNGIPSNTNLWCQTISVSPNTDYEFSAWMTNVLDNATSSTLSFSINGVEIGNPISTTTTACEWSEFFVTWNSGATTSATICIAEGTGVCSGNDFAVDDISFYGLCELVDDVTITVRPEPNASISGATTVCRNSTSPTVTLSGSAATAPYTFTYTVNGGPTQTIVSDASGQATLTVPTTISGDFEYEIIQIEDANGCERIVSESVTVTVFPDLNADISGSTSVCLGASSPTAVFSGSLGTAPYEFTYSINGGVPQTVVSNASGQASISVPTTSSGIYSYELTGVVDANGCSFSLSETEVFTIHSLPTIVSSNASVCESSTVNLTVSGGVSYSWSPATNLSSSTGSNVTFTPGSTTTYTITGTDANNCLNTTSIEVTVLPNATIVASPDVSICPGNSTTISVSGGVLYSWNNGLGTSNSHSVSPTSTTTYTVQGEDADGCIGNDEVTVTVYSSSVADISGSTSVCLGASSPTAVFSGSSGTAPYEFIYSINGGGNQVVTSNASGQANVSIPTTSPGVYNYELREVRDANSCSYPLSETEVFTIHALPTIVSPNASVCESSTVALAASGGVSYSWSPATNLSSSIGGNVTFTPGSTTTYTITGTDANNCTNTTNITVTVNALPIVNAGTDIFGCENDIHTLSGSGTALSYVWNNGVVDGVPFVAPVGVTSYTVTGINANGCQNTDVLVIDIQEAPQMSFVVQQDEYCYPVTARFINTTPAVQNCLWILDNGETITGCSDTSYVFNHPGAYGLTLRAESLNGCVSQLYEDSMVIIDPYPIASFYVTPESISMLNPEVRFVNTSWGAVSYVWNFDDESFLSNQIAPVHMYPDDKGRVYNVSLIVISEHGCMDTTISVVTIKDELIFYIPNTFTPDGNQFNQTFFPVFNSGFDPFNYSLLIFNRWGEKVFESHDPTVGWDGTYGVSGSISPDGTYTWKIDVKIPDYDERRTFTGYVNLLR